MESNINVDLLNEIIRKRRSIRIYKDELLDLECLTELVESAVWAPSASNIQPWQFIVITDRSTIQLIESFGPGMPRGAGAVIAVCSDQKLVAKRGGSGELSALDCAFATQNLLLAAHTRNIGSCVVCSFDAPSISFILSLPEHIRLELLVSLGYFDQIPVIPARRNLSQIIFHNEWTPKA